MFNYLLQADPTSGTFFLEGLVSENISKAILNLPFKKSGCQLMTKECALSNCKLPTGGSPRNSVESSQTMEDGITLSGFLEAESSHGVRYINIMAADDSSVYSTLLEIVHV